jgi:hypothetical protein
MFSLGQISPNEDMAFVLLIRGSLSGAGANPRPGNYSPQCGTDNLVIYVVTSFFASASCCYCHLRRIHLNYPPAQR